MHFPFSDNLFMGLSLRVLFGGNSISLIWLDTAHKKCEQMVPSQMLKTNGIKLLKLPSIESPVMFLKERDVTILNRIVRESN